MAFTFPESSVKKADPVEPAIRQINRKASISSDAGRVENATAFVLYLYENGIHDEEDLIELALLAGGKRYDPTTGAFV